MPAVDQRVDGLPTGSGVWTNHSMTECSRLANYQVSPVRHLIFIGENVPVIRSSVVDHTSSRGLTSLDWAEAKQLSGWQKVATFYSPGSYDHVNDAIDSLIKRINQLLLYCYGFCNTALFIWFDYGHCQVA